MSYDNIDELNEEQLRRQHQLYQQEWWTRGRSLEDVRTMLSGPSYVYGVSASDTGELAGFARVLTDGDYV